MPQNISLQGTVVTINGHHCRGWAAAADALSLPDITVAAHEIGADGLKVVSSTGMRGGIVTFKFQANSISRKQFSRWFSVIQRGAALVFEGSINSAASGERVVLTRGHMEVGPAGTTLGNTTAPAREFQIHFEEIIGNYDNFDAHAPPLLAYDSDYDPISDPANVGGL